MNNNLIIYTQKQWSRWSTKSSKENETYQNTYYSSKDSIKLL